MIKPNATLSEALNRAPLDLFHLRVVLTVGMGFLTDAYDLFIVTAVLSLIQQEFHPNATEVQFVSSTTLIAAFFGAVVCGWIADKVGRNAIYGVQVITMAIMALASAFSPNIVLLLISRFILGIAIGGNYPVSAVLMSEYANAKDRGKLVGMVFAMQAVGLVAGPLLTLLLLSTNISYDLAWRLLLGLGAIPAIAAFFLRRSLPESPRFLSRVKGDTASAARELQAYSKGRVTASPASEGLRLQARLSQYLLPLLGTAGTWFVFDYAYYGNSISTPLILHQVAPDASLLTNTFWTLVIFLVAAVPGYILAFNTMDRIGHKRLQWIGFLCMGLAFLAIGILPGITQTVVPFLLVYSISYFFAEFGPNTTTFVLSAELFPVNLRATGHGIAAGIAKLGAFISVFLFRFIESQVGLNGALEITCVFSLIGALLTLVLPEPAGRSLEEASREDPSQSLTTPAQPQPVRPSAVV